MKKVLFLTSIVMLVFVASCSKDNNNESNGKNEYAIVFNTYNAFNLGEQKDITFSFPKNTPANVKVRNIPTGWIVGVSNSKLSITCGINVGVSGEYSLDVILEDNNGKEYIHPMIIKSDISVGTPFFVNPQKVGIIAKEKNAYSQGIILYKKTGQGDWYDCSEWISDLRPEGMWKMPSVDELQIIRDEFSKNENEFNGYLTSIEGDVIGSMYWSVDEYVSSVSPGTKYAQAVGFTGTDAGNVRPAIKNSHTLNYAAIKIF